MSAAAKSSLAVSTRTIAVRLPPSISARSVLLQSELFGSPMDGPPQTHRATHQGPRQSILPQGGQLVLSGGFGVRATYDLPAAGTGWTMDGVNANTGGSASALGVYQMLWNQGVLKKDGANTGTFAQNFSYAWWCFRGTLTAIPEPSAALIGGLGMLCLLRRRR